MPVNPEGISTLQLALFDFQKTSSSAFELFPKVWGAIEALADAQVANRQAGLDCLEELNAARFSPLVAYVLFTRLDDPDLAIRARVITLFADVLHPDSQGQFAPETVRQTIFYHLSGLHPRQIYALLEAAVFDSATTTSIAALLKNNCQAGSDLTTTLADRKTPLAIRKQAANFIAQVGYVDALPAIERLIGRLEARVNGQQAFIVNPADSLDEAELLPILLSVSQGLKAP